MDLEAAFAFIRRQPFAVVSRVHDAGTPQAALVGIAVTPDNEIVFDTTATTRKAINLRARPAVALVIGWNDETTVQLEGVAREPAGRDLTAVKAAYFAAWPDGRNREGWQSITYFAVRPRWLRYACYLGAPEIVEFRM